jgi:hypothetical protein
MARLPKILVPALLALALPVVASPASAGPPLQNTHEMVRETVTWTLPADQCPDLPAGVSVSGAGERKLVKNTKVNADGSSRVIINDLVKGEAVGSNGDVYHFLYQNHSIEEAPSGGGPIQVSMEDTFVLNGDGVHLNVGFNWRWTYTPPAGQWPPVDNWQQISTRGDPFLCDPI